jgi:hypothetical protein
MAVSKTDPQTPSTKSAQPKTPASDAKTADKDSQKFADWAMI